MKSRKIFKKIGLKDTKKEPIPEEGLIYQLVIGLLFLNNDPVGMHSQVTFNNHQVNAFSFR